MSKRTLLNISRSRVRINPLALKRIARDEAYKVVNQQTENKRQLLSGALSASTTIAFSSQTNISQGTADTSRDGDEIIVKNMRYRFTIAAADTTNVVRLILFWWDQATTPVLADLFSDAAGDVNSVLDNPNGNARVIMDKTVALSTTGSNNVVFHRFDKFYKRGIKVEYGSSTATDLRRNELVLAYVSDSGAVTHPTVDYRGIIEFSG